MPAPKPRDLSAMSDDELRRELHSIDTEADFEGFCRVVRIQIELDDRDAARKRREVGWLHDPMRGYS